MDSKSSIRSWLADAAKELKYIGIESARLDAEIILAHTLRKSRTWLHAHNDEDLEPRFREIADARLELRKDFTPVAYIIGHKEFYGRTFQVTPSTLIPRPESETVIDLLKKHIDTSRLFKNPSEQLIDVGTGSGCLGITAKLELPELEVTLSDVSRHTLTVAHKNADKLGAQVEIIESNLLANYPLRPNYILANLPYVDKKWQTNKEIEHEPELALFADDNGLKLINKLIKQASQQLESKGLVILEADPRQHQSIIKIATEHGFNLLDKQDFIVVLSK